MSKLDGFNRIAPWYDPLKRLVFGSAIPKSQLPFPDVLPRYGHLLVLGGGSGEILPSLLRDLPGARICYIEASSAMLMRAQARVPSATAGRVEFVHGTEDSIPPNLMFDAVVTHFFLDLFPAVDLMRVCETVENKLKDDGVWLVSDFADGGRRWQRFLLWLMYRFFAVTSGVRARRLPPWQHQLEACGLRQVAFVAFCGGFIRSCVYRKSPRNFV